MKKFLFLVFALTSFSFVGMPEASADLKDDLSGPAEAIWGEVRGQAAPDGSFSLPEAERFKEVGENTSLRAYILRVLNFALSFLGLIAVAVIIYAGFRYVTAAGDEGTHDQAKNIIIYAGIGIIVILASFALVNTLLTHLPRGTDDRNVCGNGIIEPPEQCEINRLDADGELLGTPQLAPGWSWPEGEEGVCPSSCLFDVSFASGAPGSGVNPVGGGISGGGVTNVPVSVTNSTGGNEGVTNFGSGVVVSLDTARAGLTFTLNTPTKVALFVFGDGTQQEAGSDTGGSESRWSVNHRFGEERIYRMQIVAKTLSEDVITSELSIVVGGVQADFTATNTTPVQGEAVSLNASRSRASVGSIVGYQWSCDQSSVCTFSPSPQDQNPTVTFSQSGTFTVTLRVETSTGASESDAQIFHALGNQPTASFEAFPDASNPLRYTFQARNSRNVAGGTSGLNYEWTFRDSNGQALPGPTSGSSLSYTFPRAGSYNVDLVVTESSSTGNVLRSEVFTVPIEAQIAVDFIMPTSLEVGRSTVFRAQSAEATRFGWSVDPSGGVSIDNTSLPEPTFNFSQAGMFDVTLEVNNGEGRMTKTVFVRNSGQPLAVPEVTVGGTSVPLTGTIQINRTGSPAITFADSASVGTNGLTGSDANLARTWSVDGVALSGVSAVPGALRSSVGDHTVRLVVSQVGNGNVRDEQVIRVNVENISPIIESSHIEYISGANSESADPRNFSVRVNGASDPDGSITGYRFEVLEAGRVLDVQILDAPQAFFNLSQYPGQRAFNFRVNVTDNDRGVSSATNSALYTVDNIIVNEAPVVGSISPNNGSSNGTVNTAFVFEAVASDPDGDQLTYAWDVQQEFGSAYTSIDTPPSRRQISYQFDTPGAYKVLVEVSDGLDVTTQELDVSISSGPNTPPRITQLDVNRTIQELGNIFIFFVQVEDIESAQEDLTYAWRVTDPDLTDQTPGIGGDRARFEFTPTAGENPMLTGVYTVEVIVSDEGGLVAQETRQITVLAIPEAQNEPPVLGSIALSTNVEVKEPFAFRVEASDPDGDDTELTYLWSMENTDTLDVLYFNGSPDWVGESPGGIANLASGQFETEIAGDYTLKVSVSDGENIVRQERSFRIDQEALIPDQPPIVELIEVSSPLRVETSFSFAVDATDPEEGDLNYLWSIKHIEGLTTQYLDGSSGWGSSRPDPTLDLRNGFFTPEEEGSYEIKVQVSDENNVREQKRTIRVTPGGETPNTPANVGYIEADFVQQPLGSTFHFRVAASDEDGDRLGYEWKVIGPDFQEVNLGEPFVETGLPTFTFQTTEDTDLGPHEVMVTVQEDDGGDVVLSEVTRTFIVNITPSIMPSNSAMVVGPLEVDGVVKEPGESFNFLVSASDRDGDTISYTWKVRDPGFLEMNVGDRTGSRFTFSTQEDAPTGEYRIEVTVVEKSKIDEEIELSRITREQRVRLESAQGVDVINTAPRILSVSIPSSVGVGQDFTSLVSASDQDEGDELSYAWSMRDSLNNSVNSFSGTTPSIVRSVPNEGVYTIQVDVTDSGIPVQSVRQTRQIRVNADPVVQNDPPIITRVEALPQSLSGTLEDGFSIAMRVMASDDTTENLTYSWNVREVSSFDFSPFNGLPGDPNVGVHVPSGPGRYEMQVTVVDGEGASVSVSRFFEVKSAETPEETISENNAPQISSVSVPSSVGVGQSFTSFVSASDLDSGDTLSYIWSARDSLNNPVSNFGGTDASVQNSIESAGTYTIQVEVIDNGTPVKSASQTRQIQVQEGSDTLPAQNTPPRITSISVSPDGGASQFVGDTFWFLVEAEDAEDFTDDLTYTFEAIVPPDFSRIEVPAKDDQKEVAVYVPEVAGSHEVRLTVTDQGGLSTTQTRTVQVENLTQNTPPQVQNFSILDSDESRKYYLFQIQAEDSDEDDILTYVWSIVEGENTLNPEGTDILSHTFENPGTYTVSVAVSDGQNDPTISDSIEVVIPESEE